MSQNIQLDPERIQAITDLPPPTDTRALRCFIGMVQFCSKFIDRLNVILAPLYDLLRNNCVFIWTDSCRDAFQQLKSLLTSPPMLYSPSVTDTFFLETNTSDVGLGGCQKAVNGGSTFMVGYCSKMFVN